MLSFPSNSTAIIVLTGWTFSLHSVSLHCRFTDFIKLKHCLSYSKSIFCNKSSHRSCCVSQKKINRVTARSAFIRINIYVIGFYWDLSQSWIPMSKLRPITTMSHWLRSMRTLSCASLRLWDPTNQPQTQQAHLARISTVRVVLSINGCIYYSVVTVAFCSMHGLIWLLELKKTPWYNQAGEMPDRCSCYLMFSISNTHPSVKPQSKQVCRGPALSNQSETPWWLVHTCVGKFKNGKEVRTWEIYGVFVVKGRQTVQQFACGCYRGCGGGCAWMDGSQYIYMDYNFVIVNYHIMVTVWLKHFFSSKLIPPVS